MRWGLTHVEVGTVTALTQPGNPKPRLFRLPRDRALVNRMGFNNDGAEVVATRLAALRHWGGALPIIGVNIGKSRVIDIADATADYVTSAQLLAPHADYLVVNVSSPNTPGLRGLQETAHAEATASQSRSGVRVDTAAGKNFARLRRSGDRRYRRSRDRARLVAGIIATNTTTSRDGVITKKGNSCRNWRRRPFGRSACRSIVENPQTSAPKLSQGDKCIISVGGIFTGGDVKDRLDARSNPGPGIHRVCLSGATFCPPRQYRAGAAELAGFFAAFNCALGSRNPRICSDRMPNTSGHRFRPCPGQIFPEGPFEPW